MLLLIVKGACSYESIQTYNNIVYSTFKEGCKAHGLLDDDLEWFSAFNETVTCTTSNHLRHLFVTMLLHCQVTDEYAFFEKVWKFLTDDILYYFLKALNDPNYQIPENELKNHMLDKLALLFNKSGGNIQDFNLPHCITTTRAFGVNHFIKDELCHDTNSLLEQSRILISQLSVQQLNAFNTIVETVLSNNPGFYFISGYGGTGKTFIWNAVVAHLRTQKKIVLTVASSGVASLPNGHTTHLRFKTLRF
jgi:hypothetical protein